MVYSIMRHGPHIHLVCRLCGQVTEADYPLIEPLGKQFQEQYGFMADLQHISIFGLCKKCQSSYEDANLIEEIK